MFDSDVLVVGGGPAGLAVAIAARAQGLRVTLADGQKPPIDKACGEGLMPDAIHAARRLGVTIAPEDGQPFRGVRFLSGGHSAAADFPAGCGLGVRRTVLQRRLTERAEASGVELLWGTPVSGIGKQTAELKGQAFTARWIVGADGSQSRVRQWAGLPPVVEASRRFSQRRHYRLRPFSEYMEVHWGHGCQYYVTPVGEEEVCLVLMSRDPQARIDTMLRQFPALAERFEGAEAVTRERGAYAAARRLPRVTRGHYALVGDASGSVDPVTGEGICLAFQQGMALAEALADGDLQRYERAHRSIGRRSRRMSNLLLLLDRSDGLRRRTVAGFAREPQLFSNLLASHVGQLGGAGLLQTVVSFGLELVGA